MVWCVGLRQGDEDGLRKDGWVHDWGWDAEWESDVRMGWRGIRWLGEAYVNGFSGAVDVRR